MAYKDQYSVYKRANETVSEMKQLIMLYEGAINFVEQAKEAIDENNFEKRYNLIIKADAIINGLNSCLKFTDETQETAEALDRFYQDMDLRLLYVNCSNSKDDCDAIIADLRIMLNAWKDIEKETSPNKTDEAEVASESEYTSSSDVRTPPPLLPLQDVEITV